MLLTAQVDLDGQTRVAIVALSMFVDVAHATEPVGWIRAYDGRDFRRQSREEAGAQFEAALLRWNEGAEDEPESEPFHTP